MEQVCNMVFASSLTNLCEVNHSFDSGVLRVCYTGKNNNKTFISKAAIERNIKTIFNCPIVCNYKRDVDELGGHDVAVIKDPTGGLRLINLTQPVGVVPESANVWFEDFEEEDGTVHEYLYVDVLLWKRQEAYRKIKEDGITSQSMEIKILDQEKIDGVTHINDFEFNAFALIGVKPCFESASLETFSLNDFKEQMSEMMKDLKENYSLVNTSNDVDEINSQNSKEGGNGKMNKKELAAKYGIDIETLDFSIDDLSEDELEAKFAEIANSNQEPKPEENFALLGDFINEVRMSLSQAKVAHEWGETPKYCYVDLDNEASEVYCWDTEDWLLYGFTYSMNGDNVVIDFESKKRMKYAIVPFDEGVQDSPFMFAMNMVEEKFNSVKEYESKYNDAFEKISTMEAELTDLRKYKADNEESKLSEARNELFSKFADLEGIESFGVLKENCAQYSLDELKKECFAIRGEFGTAQANFSLNEQKPKQKVVPPTLDENEPYGGLFVRYGTDNK